MRHDASDEKYHASLVENDRRQLQTFPEAKLITAKRDCLVGNHYHKQKTEWFLLSEGSCEMTLDGKTTTMVVGLIYAVLPGVHHAFALSAGSKLVGLNSLQYNPQDDFTL